MLRLVLSRYVFLFIAALAAMAGAGALLPTPHRAAAQPQPMLTLSPPSGPCDATVQVSGSAFPVPSSPLDSLGLYLLQPGTVDVNMGILNAASVGRDGTFSQAAPLWERGCEAAALDSQADQPTGNLVIVARSGQGPVGPDQRISDIIATAQYVYATTTAHIPTETLAILPASGPCDGAVEVRGSGFEPGIQVLLKLGRPGSDDTLGTLASATAEGTGAFVVEFTLGDLGCRAAQLNMTFGDPGQPRIGIGVFRAAYPTPPQGIPPVLASVSYTYTTTTVSLAPRALPLTGNGPDERPTLPVWLPLAVAVAGVGFVLAGGILYRSRRLRR